MVDGLDVVSVRVESERSIVARVVLALAGRTVAATAVGESGCMEGGDCGMARRLERQVNRGDLLVGSIDPQLVGREVVLVFSNALALAECLEHCAIEPLARFEVADAKVHVIDEPAAMELHEGDSLGCGSTVSESNRRCGGRAHYGVPLLDAPTLDQAVAYVWVCLCKGGGRIR